MIPTQGENYIAKVQKRKENSNYEYSQEYSIIFKCRPAREYEISSYQILEGLSVNTSDMYIYASNLPSSIKPGDRILYLNKLMTISTIGVFLNQTPIVSGASFSSKYIIDRAPKGLTVS